MRNAIIYKMRVAFQGEPGAFSEEAAVQLLGDGVTTVPRPTFDSTFRAISDGVADALLAPVENTLAGSVVRVYDLLLESALTITAETILPIEHYLIGCPGSVREALSRGDRSCAAIAGRRAAEHYGGVILAEDIQDNAENFTRFVLLVPVQRDNDGARDSPSLASPGVTDIMVELHLRGMDHSDSPRMLKMSLALRLAHRPGALLAALEPFSRLAVNLLKIESRPIHGRPWEYQFFVDVEAENTASLSSALADVRKATSDLRMLGLYTAARGSGTSPEGLAKIK
jgi:prephenate dehydratase